MHFLSLRVQKGVVSECQRRRNHFSCSFGGDIILCVPCTGVFPSSSKYICLISDFSSHIATKGNTYILALKIKLVLL